MISNRLKKQLDFIIEIDKIKNIFRMSYIADGSRRENDAEHSWHLGIMTAILSEYVEDDVDISKVLKMVLIHDLVEIYAGDTFAFDEVGYIDKLDREEKAAEDLFGILPEDQKEEFKVLWKEFEECKTREAKFGAMLDRLQPLILDYATKGKGVKESNLTAEKLYKRNEITMEEGPEEFKELVKYIIEEVTK
ncbi:HD domain-containing protein [uncultured Clostridium sp.]|uniref:HD domain-containing protein n=1 Tax=uncultured Clostridium sp. TaxID=59620 RepID=UPI0025E526D4|nr:HD domain-containing protein [uncultured Clostridium sp.]